MNKKICAAWIAALVVGAYASPSEDQTDQVLIKFSEASPSAKGLKEQDLTFLKNALVAVKRPARTQHGRRRSHPQT
jgi:hypothetical protein